MVHLYVPSGQTRTSFAWTLARLLSSITNPYVHGAPSVAGSLWIFAHFISSVILSSESKASTLLVTLVYLNRVKSCLDPESFGVTRVRERIFLGAIVLATKYTEDYPPENWEWVRVARMFTARDISNAESRLLHALDWDLSVTECSVREQEDGVATIAGYYRI